MDADGYLDRLYVHKDYQGRGVATALCDALEQAVQCEAYTTHASITARRRRRIKRRKARVPAKAGRRGFPLCFCSFARPRSGESLRCAVAEDNMLRLRAVQPVGVAENDEADDEDHGDRADGDALVAGRLADDGDDQRAKERRALAADVEQARSIRRFFSAGMIFAK